MPLLKGDRFVADPWIVVGADEGYVRRISVRSTEIETFDRSTIIVPVMCMLLCRSFAPWKRRSSSRKKGATTQVTASKPSW